MTEPLNLPMRINRYLEISGATTRRGVDDLIKRGLVTVNGRPAVLGYVVKTGDKVEVLAGAKSSIVEPICLAYHKPRGVTTEAIVGLLKSPSLFPLGRLDKESEGLIIVTNDGRLTDRLLNPKFAHEKEYEVETREKVTPMIKKILTGGVTSRGERLQAKTVELLDSHRLSIVLTAGRKHQIRRMLDGARLTVVNLKRTRIMNLKLGRLRPGQSRALTESELKDFLAMLY